MLLNKTAKVTLSSQNIEHYRKLGYIIPTYKDSSYRIKVKRGTEIEVRVKDMPNGSKTLVNVKCDCEDCKDPYLKPIPWDSYLRYVNEDGKYYCNRCAVKLTATEKRKKTVLKNSISFEKWCYDNLDVDYANEILSRWDAEKNGCLPSEVTYKSKGIDNKGYWFECLYHKEHKSELKNISYFIKSVKECDKSKTLECNQCNSIGQYLLDMYGENALELYWDYENNMTNPFEISHGNNNKKIWIKCQEKDCHESYNTYCNSFYKGSRCPNCSHSKGERKIKELLFENNIKFISQKSYKNLLGLGLKRLSYDFYLPQYNLLIEYQGEFHDGTADFQTEEGFKKQQEHDRRKREYAITNNINLLEIWYWDFNNIEKILNKELNNK